MKCITFVALVLLVFLFTSSSLTVPGYSIEFTDKNPNNDQIFDLKVKLLMRQNRLSSLVICILKDNNISFIKAYGYSNRYLMKKADVNTIYLAGSISKSVTATALMQLYEKGFFDLDDSVSDYLPFDLKNPNYPNVNITFRMLLSHQSSLNDFGLRIRNIPYIWYKSRHDNKFQCLEEMLNPKDKLYNKRYFLNYAPGENARYCEIGFMLAGYLVERITNQSLEDYCRENIFQPLDMKNTSFDFSSLDRGNVARPYGYFCKLFFPLPKYELYLFDPAAGLWTTAEDLSHFLMMHLNGGVYNGKRILKEENVCLMHSIQCPDCYDLLLGNFLGGELTLRHGLGWMHINLLGHKLEGHAGGAPGYNCHMYVLRDDESSEDIGLVLMGNGPILCPAALYGKTTVNSLIKMLELIEEKIGMV